MKKILYSVALLAATMIGFTSCDEEEEKPDFRDQAIGEYNVTLKQYYAIENSDADEYTLYTMESVMKASGATDCPDLSKQFTATLSKDGEGLKLTATSVFSDEWTFVKLAEASNGFTFDIKEYEAVVDNAGTKAKFTNYPGAKLGDVKYNGLYTNGVLKFNLKDNGEMEKAIWKPLTDDADAFAAFQEKIKGSELEKVLTDGDVILQFTCTKK